MKVLLIDPMLAGISGDMLLASLVDLKGEISELYQLAEIIEEKVNYCRRVTLSIRDVSRRGIRAKSVDLKVDEVLSGITPSRFRENVVRVLGAVDISSEARELAMKVVNELLEAEARVHFELEELHEVASVDTIFDVVGVALILDKTGLLKAPVYTTPPAIGSGIIETSHGFLPVPAPATLEIIRKHGFPYSNIKVNRELTTPTGAALLATLTKRVVDFYPPMRVVGVGYGAGLSDLAEIPNLLRVVEGYVQPGILERVVVLETSVDDITGEVLGYLFDRMFELGALDVAVIPGIGKKNRLTNLVKVVARIEDTDKIIEALISELGTLGVRVHEEPRVTVERNLEKVEVEVEGKKFVVTVKEAKRPDGKVLRIKPEYEDLKAIAKELNMPLRRVIEIVTRQLTKSCEGP
ncbi:MAG: nickel pincer cofactor biosynthesis protein LarC [Candidatus Nezhaarchaeota archaeon]|nr:nickel pincer cofactor biosynthesis protein LarC [Candidatus Nezhaarchaeota archaeon]MCX8142441.1 nickel pincer cofactor biosynthesis protein LarC [Candidatus Nezhaarchaeota archaeon]MDW8050586.1 nickel pincer cofactor biosynthesis protein LarC [Nitrososphaerota archaeon]